MNKIRNKIKSLLALKCMTLKQLAEKMNSLDNKNYTAQSLSHKLARESLSLKEAYLIAQIVGFKLEFIEIE